MGANVEQFSAGNVVTLSVGDVSTLSVGNVAAFSTTDAPTTCSSFLQFLREFNPGGTYILQAGISFSVILFCMIQLTRGEQSDVYLPVITGTAAYWLPNPKTTNAAEVKAMDDNNKHTEDLHKFFIPTKST